MRIYSEIVIVNLAGRGAGCGRAFIIIHDVFICVENPNFWQSARVEHKSHRAILCAGAKWSIHTLDFNTRVMCGVGKVGSVRAAFERCN